MKEKLHFYVRLLTVRMPLMAVLWLFCQSAFSQNLRIDFNNQSTSGIDPTSTGWTGWTISDFSTGNATMDFSDYGITVAISHGEGTKGTRIKRVWEKAAIQSGNTVRLLLGDGIASYSGSSRATGGKVAIKITVSGLSAGTHSLQAYHNCPENDAGTVSLPLINVMVDGSDVQTGVAQSLRSRSLETAGKSYVEFDVSSPSQSVDITYYTVPESGKSYSDYDYTDFTINSLEFDNSDSNNRATSPYPEDGDYHVAADNGSVTLSWTPSSNSPSQHKVYFAESEEALASASAVTVTSASLAKSGLSPLKRYYWRVDEVIGDGPLKGEVWSSQPRRDAFPGAEGYGRYAIGGRGAGDGIVYHVPSLDDDVDNPAVGTFRYGITRLTGPRTIVFDVAGVITLRGRLTCSDPYVTIAGQTAPGRGIMLKGAPFGMASDGITRFLRARLGHLGVSSETSGLDGLGMSGNDHSIMDHCSISWTIDEGFSSRNARHITLQRTLISEALNVAGHPNYGTGTAHGYAATIGGGELGSKGSSFHHNLLAHNEGRNWSMSGGLDAAGYYDGHHDMFNNVVYNWGGRATDGGTHEGQFVANYYKMGKATTQKYLLRAEIEGTGSGSQSYYVSGNIRENKNGTLTTDREGDTYTYALKNGQVLDWTVFRSAPFFDSQATVETAQAAYRNVLSDVGCNVPELDNHDVRMVNETLTGTYSTTGSYDQVSDGLIDSEEDSGCEGFSGLNIITETRPADWDTDGDGIPDWFEDVKGWDTVSANNNVCSDETTYYTQLEEYLNWMAQPHYLDVPVGSAFDIDLSLYFMGYTSPTFNVSATGASTSLSGTLLSVTPTSPGLVSVTVTASQSGITLTRTIHLYCVGTADENIYEEVIGDAGVSGTADIINSTYEESEGTTDDKNCVWLFNNGFKVGRTSGDGAYASAKFGTDNNFVKYSANYEYTITIPDGMSVTGIDIYGYSNNDTSGAYLYQLNGVTYGETDYTFPNRKSDASALPTYTFNFSQPVTGTLTFTPMGKQVCWQLTLHTQQGGTEVILKETATIFNVDPMDDVKVTLQRTLSSDYYSTFCVPFDISAEDVRDVLGNATVLELSGVSGTWLKFSEVESVTAGIPCLIRPQTDVTNPVFEHVDIISVIPQTVTMGDYGFVGHYVRYEMPYQAGELFLGVDGKLKKPKPSPENLLYGLRGTFVVPSQHEGNVQLLFGDGTDLLQQVEADQWQPVERVYNLSGQAISTSSGPLPKGVYIVNGKKTVIK